LVGQKNGYLQQDKIRKYWEYIQLWFHSVIETKYLSNYLEGFYDLV